MLSVAQQSAAVLGFIKGRLGKDIDNNHFLRDPFFLANLDYNFETLFTIYTELYGHRHECLESLVSLVRTLAQSWHERSHDLKTVDKQRLLKPSWFMSQNMIGGQCYVDLYAGHLEGIRSKIPYFRELGLTYLHLLPLYKRPERQSDGGYAVSSYRELDGKLGSIEDLRMLAKELHDAGICLVLDLIMNHTSNEHEWAKQAAAGDPEHSGFYWMYPDRTVPNEFERSLRKVNPSDHAGNFVQLPDGRWVWSTFQTFQWDLNYSNPAVFGAMAEEMLFLANVGASVFKMDSASFLWKQMGTTCENLPQTHLLIRAFNAMCKIAAPSILFQSASVSHPKHRLNYIDPSECQLSYNSLESELAWEALATRDTSMLQQSLERWHNLAAGERCHWVNYVRTNDDMSWSFTDEDASELLIHGHDHRRFLNTFYVNRYPGSFARGVAFKDAPGENDCRVAGTAASLAGFESGEEHAVERLLLLYAIAFSTGGIALLYLGDEVAQLNDYAMLLDPDKCHDSRWIHRPHYPAHHYEQRLDRSTMAGKTFHGLKHLIDIRKTTEEFAGSKLMGFHTDNKHILGFLRFGPRSKLLCLANFHDKPQTIAVGKFAALPARAQDLVSGREVMLRGADGLQLLPHQVMWLRH